MSASVDFRAGSTASRGLGGGGGGRRGGRGGGRGGRGGKDHYTPKNDFVTSTTVAIEAKKTATADLRHIKAKHPVRRQLIWRKNRETNLARHPSYGIAVEMQARGNLNATPCNSCSQGAGPFETGCASFSAGYSPKNKDALAEIRGLERALAARGRALEGGATVEDVSSEDDVESEGEGSTWEGFE
ncbi:hypothetical protein VE02_06637 [Pseudogymnoascus sp. 03VT05]|nr:hypothetical protein VE02_06637 [Pseudogymnoascus sp. 03VT05]